MAEEAVRQLADREPADREPAGHVRPPVVVNPPVGPHRARERVAEDPAGQENRRRLVSA